MNDFGQCPKCNKTFESGHSCIGENPFAGAGGRFINIESVLKSLDKRVTELEREATSPQPQLRAERDSLQKRVKESVSKCDYIADLIDEGAYGSAIRECHEWIRCNSKESPDEGVPT